MPPITERRAGETAFFWGPGPAFYVWAPALLFVLIGQSGEDRLGQSPFLPDAGKQI